MRFVGVDAHIDPWSTIEFVGDFRKNGSYRRGDVGIAPYAFFVNPSGMSCIAPTRFL